MCGRVHMHAHTHTKRVNSERVHVWGGTYARKHTGTHTHRHTHTHTQAHTHTHSNLNQCETRCGHSGRSLIITKVYAIGLRDLNQILSDVCQRRWTKHRMAASPFTNISSPCSDPKDNMSQESLESSLLLMHYPRAALSLGTSTTVISSRDVDRYSSCSL